MRIHSNIQPPPKKKKKIGFVIRKHRTETENEEIQKDNLRTHKKLVLWIRIHLI